MRSVAVIMIIQKANLTAKSNKCSDYGRDDVLYFSCVSSFRSSGTELVCMTTYGVVGSRCRTGEHDYQLIVNYLRSVWRDGDTLVSGGCPTGADAFAERIAAKYELPITVYRADWKEYGKMAGPIRNKEIAWNCDVLVALLHPWSHGTKHCVEQATILDREVVLL